MIGRGLLAPESAVHPNADLLRAGYEAFAQGDVAALRNVFFARDCVWHQPGRHHLAGVREGVDAVLDLFLNHLLESNGTLSLELRDVLANERHAVALVTMRAEKGGRFLEDRYVHVARVELGRIVESWVFSEDQPAVDAFWG